MAHMSCSCYFRHWLYGDRIMESSSPSKARVRGWFPRPIAQENFMEDFSQRPQSVRSRARQQETNGVDEKKKNL